MASKIKHFADGDVVRYIYAQKETQGTIELWFLSSLSKYDTIEWTKHAEGRLEESNLTKVDIENFLTSKRVLVVWRPNYKSTSGLQARITGELKDVGLITVIVDNDLSNDNELIIHTAYRISHSEDDIKIYNEGLEMMSRYVELEEGPEDER